MRQQEAVSANPVLDAMSRWERARARVAEAHTRLFGGDELARAEYDSAVSEATQAWDEFQRAKR